MSDDDVFSMDVDYMECFDAQNQNVIRSSGFEDLGKDKQENLENILPSLSSEYLFVKRELQKVDKAAVQLRLALDLRKRIEMCSSERTYGNLPLKLDVETLWLHSGSLFLQISLTNESANILDDWNLTVCTRTLSYRISEDDSPLCKSNVINLGILLNKETYKGSLHFPISSLCLPLLLEFQMSKIFELDPDEPPCVFSFIFGIPLDSRLISLWNMCSFREQLQGMEKNSTKSRFGTSSISVPCALVNLLSGCPNDDHPSNLLRLIFADRSKIENGIESVEVTLALSRSEKHECQVAVSRKANFFDVSILVKDVRVRNMLTMDLKALIIAKCSSLTRRPVGSLFSIPDMTSLDTLFTTTLHNYST